MRPRLIEWMGWCLIGCAPVVEAPAPSGFTLELSPKTLRFTWPSVPQGTTELYVVEQAREGAPLERIADLPVDATSWATEVPLFRRLGATWWLQTCTDDDCVRSQPVTLPRDRAAGVLAVEGPEPDGATELGFGLDLALSGDGSMMALSAPWSGSSSAFVDADRGSVFVMTKGPDGWEAEAPLSPAWVEAGHQFGTGLGINRDGHVMVASAPGAPNEGCHWGVTSLFERTVEGEWLETRLRTVSPNYVIRRAVLDASGTMLAAIGLPLTPSCTTDLTLLVYRKQKGAWSLVDANPLAAASDLRLSGDGQRIVLSSLVDNRVLVLERGSTRWETRATLTPTSQWPNVFGSTLEVNHDGTVVAVGDQVDRGLDRDQWPTGSVTIFVEQNGSWSVDAYLTPAPQESCIEYGQAISLDAAGTTLVVSAPQTLGPVSDLPSLDAPPHGWDNGAVYAYERREGEWHSIATIRPDSAEAGWTDVTGTDVALDDAGTTLAVSDLLRPLRDTGGASEARARPVSVRLY